MTALAFTVLHGPWWADGDGPYVDDVVVDDASPSLIRIASHAHAAGVVEVTEGLDVSAIQSQEDGEAAYTAAQDSGDWQIGNVAQHDLQTAQVAVDRAHQDLADAQADDTVTDAHAQAVEDAEASLAGVDADIRERIFGAQA